MQRKFNVAVTVTLLRNGLITITDEDMQLAKWLGLNPRPSLQDFAAGFLRECLTMEPPLASRQTVPYALDALQELVQNGKATEQYVVYIYSILQI